MSDGSWGGIDQLSALVLLLGASIVLAKMLAKAIRGALIEFGSSYFYPAEVVVFWATLFTLTGIILKIVLFPSQYPTK